MKILSVLKEKIQELKDRKKCKREYNNRLTAIQKDHTPDKWEARKPYNWKKQWGPFIKYDADWDGFYLLGLIIYKLEKMYISLDIYSNEVRSSLDKNLKVLQQAIDLGKKILKFDYFQESDKFSDLHCAHVVYIYDNEGKKGIEAMHSQKLLAKVPSSRVDVDNITDGSNLSVNDIPGDLNADKWVKEHGYTRDQVHYTYGGEWDDQANHDVWLKMLKAEVRFRQKETDQFFKLISRNYRDWWW